MKLFLSQKPPFENEPKIDSEDRLIMNYEKQSLIIYGQDQIRYSKIYRINSISCIRHLTLSLSCIRWKIQNLKEVEILYHSGTITSLINEQVF